VTPEVWLIERRHYDDSEYWVPVLSCASEAIADQIVVSLKVAAEYDSDSGGYRRTRLVYIEAIS
jgi:hypothetical protein